MKLSNEQYDVAKNVVTVVVPAAIALITGLGALYQFDTTAITGTIALLATFAGTVLGVSSRNYQKEQEAQNNEVE
ncbi:holin [Streptococcus phage Dp-1]|uniref:Holin n=1 Tax=Pneumococcus phage Dp-1 TaxID=59241 RepID=HOLIN_BPDP1|nr:holin [Streptococcus phage Dp-1]O03978.1 RecName: Full=Holin [Streptococcus phage Dp-1]ADT64065.1 holin [Streptococcus phage Dp-1]CAB07985.1 holin [Streptococcus phage Dp-1]